MDVLTLEKALKLYKIIGKYIPDDIPEDMLLLDFVGIILDKIKEGGHLMDYARALEVMTGLSVKDISSFQPEEVVATFADGLTKNNVLMLKSFCTAIGFGNG